MNVSTAHTRAMSDVSTALGETEAENEMRAGAKTPLAEVIASVQHGEAAR